MDQIFAAFDKMDQNKSGRISTADIRISETPSFSPSLPPSTFPLLSQRAVKGISFPRWSEKL